jgi:hypothetical protein
MSFETWIDRQISRAEESGAFADLPGAGRPLPRRDRPESTYEWALRWASRENGGLTGMLPPGLALRKEREDLPERVVGAPSETAIRALVEDFNDRVQEFWRRPQEGPPVAVGMADVDELVALWRASRPAALPPPEPLAAVRRRRWPFSRRRV